MGPLSRSTIGIHEPYVVRSSSALRLCCPFALFILQPPPFFVGSRGEIPLRPVNYPELAKIAGNFRQPADRTSENSNSSLLWSFKGHVEEPASPGAVASATCRPEGQVNAVAHAVSLAVRTPNCKLGNRWAVGLQFA